MQNDPHALNITPSLHRQFNRLKAQCHFNEDTDLLQAALEALDRQASVHDHAPNPLYSTEPYMKYPGLAMDDYDT